MNQHIPLDAWGKLWDRATSEPEGPAVIEVDPEDAGRVSLVWPDKSRMALVWDDGDWRICGSLDTAPCDVSARDTL